MSEAERPAVPGKGATPAEWQAYFVASAKADVANAKKEVAYYREQLKKAQNYLKGRLAWLAEVEADPLVDHFTVADQIRKTAVEQGRAEARAFLAELERNNDQEADRP